MKLWSQSWPDGQPIPPRFAAGRLDPKGGVRFSDNINPHLAWSDAPSATQSFALVCHDPDVPSSGEDVNKSDREVPTTLPRVDFFHWVLVDLPASVREVAEGEFSSGFTTGGKPGPQAKHGARQGLNDYTGWFASDVERKGSYFGYDGPFPPFNDALMHRYVFTLYALSVPRLDLEGPFSGAQARQALAGHIVAQARWVGHYSLNRRLIGVKG